VDDDNHALAALRYLILCLDQRKLARPRKPIESAAAAEQAKEAPAKGKEENWLSVRNPFLWTDRGLWHFE
jgi:hypothetical protein